MIDFSALAAPFPPEAIQWRVGSTTKDKSKGMALAYIDARDVQDRLDNVCGQGNWQNRFPHASDKKTVCEIGIRVDGEWVWKADGAGDTDFEADKGALSDAFKRCAVKWGIGRYLYDTPTKWVQIDQYGKILDTEMDVLRGILKKSGLATSHANPGKFWQGAKLTVSLPTKHVPSDDQGLSDEAIEWAADAILKGIEKAPSRELLAKFQNDNTHWLARFPRELADSITEKFSVRAQQFDNLKG